MNIGRIFANAIARRVAYVVVGFALYMLAGLFGASDAHAQAGFCGTNAGWPGNSCTLEQAATQCQASVDATLAWYRANDPGGDPSNWQKEDSCNRLPGWDHTGGTLACSVFYPGWKSAACGTQQNRGNQAARFFHYVGGCPVGQEWRDDLGKCFNPEECLQRNGAANGMPAIESARPFKERCVAGCQLKIEGPGSCTSIVGQAGSMMCSGVFQYSGNACSATPPDDPNEPPPPPEPEETCKDAASGGGLKVCKKKDGQECVSTKTGVSICWGTHETGEKSVGNEQQARGAGTDEPSPTPPTPPETFDPAQKTAPVTTQTTTTNPNGSTTTTTVTTVSNGTTNGTQPPGTPVAPGGGGGQPGQGEDDEGNSASGGGDCETPPVVEGDAALGMIAKQAWETRCALEKIGKGAKVTGDVGDCDSPFTVEGDDASAKELRAMRAQICPGGDAAKNGDGDAIDGSGIDGPDSAEGSVVFVTETFGEEGLNTVGLGFSRTCPVMPQITVLGNVIQFDNSVMCQWLELGGQILLILSALVSVRIMAGVGT